VRPAVAPHDFRRYLARGRHPAGIEHFFAETLERATSLDAPVPDNVTEVAARYAEAAPRYGMTFV
jgi:hypothetical protein